MKLFTRDAERLLFEKVKTISVQHESWRCLYIGFSDYPDEYSEGLRIHVVTTIINGLLTDDEGYIYLCEDGDVFILFQGKAAPILDKLGEYFKGLGAGAAAAQPGDDLYTVFDLSRHWQIFYTLCKNKAAWRIAEPVREVSPPPARAADALPRPDAALFRAAAARRASRAKLRVLIVEDDPFTRRLAASTLKGEFDVIEAGDGAEAIRVYESAAPDAVFLDIELPDASGHAVLDRLIGFDTAAYIVMLSANSVRENILAALEKGAHGFVAKPFAREKLVHYLRLCAAMRAGETSAESEVSHD